MAVLYIPRSLGTKQVFSLVPRLTRIGVYIWGRQPGSETTICTRAHIRMHITEKRLNSCVVLLHVHKEIVNQMDLLPIARSFVALNDERIRYFGAFT